MRDLFLSSFETSLSYATSSETSMVKSYFQKTLSGVLLSVLLGGFTNIGTKVLLIRNYIGTIGKVKLLYRIVLLRLIRGLALFGA